MFSGNVCEVIRGRVADGLEVVDFWICAAFRMSGGI